MLLIERDLVGLIVVGNYMTDDMKKYYISLAIAVNKVLDYVRDKGYYCHTYFKDSNGVYFETDIGYFLEGLEGLSDSLDEIVGD